ncbi:hypothetical protein [Neptuniibacter sp. QD37_11]|uniref:hypothetical protein n=1 Tax=Neptuniibacter sp. QD37_11 TaxID=3398209 RepID=UPI0039F63322
MNSIKNLNLGEWVLNLVVDSDSHLELFVTHQEGSACELQGLADSPNKKSQYAIKVQTISTQPEAVSDRDYPITTALCLEQWVINATTESDNTLLLAVTHEDGTEVINCDADLGDEHELAVRLTTQSIEDEYNQSQS